MLKLLLLSAVLAVVSASDFYCGTLWIQMVKDQWAQAYGYGKDREAFGEALWHKVFAAAPEVRVLFERVRADNTFSPEFRAHSLRVLAGLDMSISLLDNEADFVATMTHLHDQHKERGIDAAHYSAFKTALMETVPEFIGIECYKWDSWGVCLDEILNKLKA